MDNLKAGFQDFMSCMIEDKLSNLKSDNIEYGKCRENEKNNVKTIKVILNKLSADGKEVINMKWIFFIYQLSSNHIFTSRVILIVLSY